MHVFHESWIHNSARIMLFYEEIFIIVIFFTFLGKVRTSNAVNGSPSRNVFNVVKGCHCALSLYLQSSLVCSNLMGNK